MRGGVLTLLVLSLTAVLALGACSPGPWVRGCDAACQRVVTACKYGCPPSVVSWGGYRGANQFCDDNPTFAGCARLP